MMVNKGKRRWFRKLGIWIGCSIVVLGLGGASQSAFAVCGDVAVKTNEAVSDLRQWHRLGQPIAGSSSGYNALEEPILGLFMASQLASSWCSCVEAGGDSEGCVAKAVATKALCVATLAMGLPNPNNPFGLLSIAFPPVGVPAAAAYQLIVQPDNLYCVDKPKDGGYGFLKCCKYEPSQYGCHTAFNTPAPVNCEGNLMKPNAESFGVCMVPSSGIGCLCNHLPECALSSPMGDAYSVTHRRAIWFDALAKAYQSALGEGASSASPCGFDLGLFAGSRGWMTLWSEANPFVQLSEGGGFPTDGVLEEVAAQIVSNGALRVMFAIPNGLKRYDYVAAKTWTVAQKLEYLDGIDPEAELEMWLSSCGIDLLKESLPNRWELLAVPAPAEGPLDKDPSLDWEDGVVMGQAPDSMVLAFLSSEMDVVLGVVVDDPESAFYDGTSYPLSVDWGDDRWTHGIYEEGAENTYLHRYEMLGTYQVVATYMNSAGQVIEEVGEVSVVKGLPVSEPRYVDRLDLDVAIQSSAAAWVDFYLEDQHEQLHLVARGWSDGTGGFPVTLDYPQLLEGFGTFAPRRLWVEVGSASEGDLGQVVLASVELGLYASNGEMSFESVAFDPTTWMVVSGDATSSGPVDGSVAFPLQNGGTYVLDLPCGVCPWYSACDAAICTAFADVNGSGSVDVADVQCGILAALWDLSGGEGPLPGCVAMGEASVADVDCGGTIGVVDVNIFIGIALGAALHPEIDADGNGVHDACE